MQLPRSALIAVCTMALLWHVAPHPSALGQSQDAPSELHEKSITIKHITPVHIIWIGYQPDDRRIFRSAGGSWNVAQGTYTETMRYGLDENFKQSIFGKEFAFDCRFEGDLWIQSATLPDGSDMIETWQRIKPDEDVSMRPIDMKPEEPARE